MDERLSRQLLTTAVCVQGLLEGPDMRGCSEDTPRCLLQKQGTQLETCNGSTLRGLRTPGSKMSVTASNLRSPGWDPGWALRCSPLGLGGEGQLRAFSGGTRHTRFPGQTGTQD